MSTAKQAAIVGTAVTAAAAVIPALATAVPASASDLPAGSDVIHIVRELPAAKVLVTKIISVSARKTITIASGDTLSGIAQRFCGNPADWTGIWDQNRAEIPDPNRVYPGQVVRFTCEQLAQLASYDQPAPDPAPAYQVPAAVTGYGNVSPASYSGFEACVIARESGGNAQVMNSTGHYGLYQFSASTWAEGGGNPGDFGHASVAEQQAVFDSIMAHPAATGGAGNWAPYDGC